MQQKPNILFFFTDDQRFDTIHALGNNQIITPNMDRLVRNGTAFTQAHIPSGTSVAVCMPSRAMLHTGRNLFSLQNEGQCIPLSHITIGETLQQAGYNTFGTGKWHNDINSYARSFNDGGAIFFGGMWDHWNVPVCDYDATGKYKNITKFTMDFYHNNKPIYIHCDRYEKGRHSTELISDTAISYLENYESDKPFFMYLSYLAPHDPRDMPDQFREMYNVDSIKLPENYMDKHPFDFKISGVRDELLADFPRTPEIIKKHIAEYYAMITHLDYEIGRVIETLEKTGKLDNTIIILAGDNGLAVGQHGLLGKQNHYEHSIRVPLVFSGPRIPKNMVRHQYVYLLDIFPTLCDIIGIPIPSSVEGKSFYECIYNDEAFIRKRLYFAYTDLIRSVKNEQFKLIEYRNDIGVTQLFDILNDPHELVNLYGNKTYNNLVSSLRNDLIEFRDEWKELNHPLGQSYWYESFSSLKKNI